MGETAEVIDLTQRLPTHEEIASAAVAATALANACTKNGALVIRGVEEQQSVQLAPAIFELVIDLLGHLARGDMVTLVPTSAMLTTQQAADILNVSRPYVSKLLKDGEIPFIPIGTHRRIMHTDLLAYKERRDATRKAALNELATLGQEFDAS